MIQQIEFVIHVDIQPLRQIFFAQSQGHRSKVKFKIKD